jgi:hypothetical protein
MLTESRLDFHELRRLRLDSDQDPVLEDQLGLVDL